MLCVQCGNTDDQVYRRERRREVSIKLNELLELRELSHADIGRLSNEFEYCLDIFAQSSEIFEKSRCDTWTSLLAESD